MTIWLTGCTGGLGEALLAEFVKAGHGVAGCGRREEALEKLRERYGTGCFFQNADVSVEVEVAEFCAAALEAVGPPDLLINNAALMNAPAPLWEVPAEEFDRLMAVNISGIANVIRHALPPMIARGKGVVVNFSSGWGRSTSPEVAPYCATKWAVEGLTSALAQELPAGLGAVALNPGVIDTPMLRQAWGEGAASYPTAAEWAKSAAPFLLKITPAQNGRQLTAP